MRNKPARGRVKAFFFTHLTLNPMDKPHFTLIQAIVLIEQGLGGITLGKIEYEDGSGLKFNVRHLETSTDWYVRLNEYGRVTDGCSTVRTLAHVGARMYGSQTTVA